MNAVIYLDVPDWQIGQDVTVYFPDTMAKRGKCELLKEQDEWLHKKQHDIDRLCNEISEWKHKFHDKSLKEQDEWLHKKQHDIDRLCNEISEWKHKFHDKSLKEQEAVVHPEPSCEMTYITDCCCDLCGVQLIREDNFCRCCGKRIEWEGR